VNSPKYFEQDETIICSTVRPSIIRHARLARNQLLVDVLDQMLANWCSGNFYMYWMLKVHNMLWQHLRNLGTAEPRTMATLDFTSYCLIWTHHHMALLHLSASCNPSQVLNKVALSVMKVK
jgi:hypothetical protein